MVIKSDKTYKNLKRKGFLDSTDPRDHDYLEFYHNGKVILFTKISHGSTHDLNDYLIGQMSRQCKLNKKDFLDLALCPLSEEKYIQKLIEQGIIKA